MPFPVIKHNPYGFGLRARQLYVDKLAREQLAWKDWNDKHADPAYQAWLDAAVKQSRELQQTYKASAAEAARVARSKLYMGIRSLKRREVSGKW